MNNVMTNLRGAGTSMTNFVGSVLGTGGSDGSGYSSRYDNGRYDNGRYNDNGRGNHEHNRY